MIRSTSEILAWLEQRIVSHVPTAVVRFGDGELRLLRADPEDDTTMRSANREVEEESGQTVPPTAVGEMRLALEYARDEADMLGILGSSPDWRELPAALYADRLAAGRPPAVLTGCHVNHRLLPELPALLAGRMVSVISCRDVKPVVEERWGLEDVAVYQLPSQYERRSVDGDYEAALHGEPVWPDAHDRVLAELAVREPGEVFLVGGGPFCKDLCVHVRDRGGIALDLGSTLDHIAGKLTRGPMRTVLELHAEGRSLDDIVAFMASNPPHVSISRDVAATLVDSISPYLR